MRGSRTEAVNEYLRPIRPRRSARAAHPRDTPADPPVKPGAAPDLTPGVAGDQILEIGGETVRARDGGVDVRVAENLAPHARPGCAAVVVHRAGLLASCHDVTRCCHHAPTGPRSAVPAPPCGAVKAVLARADAFPPADPPAPHRPEP